MPPINNSTSSGIFVWSPAACLRVTGADAAEFLQGQFTNDLQALARQPAVYGLWLTVKGKVTADSFVVRGAGAGEFWIASYASSAAVIRERLESHIIADDVTVEDATGAWAAASLWGGAAGAVGDDVAGGFVFPGRRGRAPNLEWLFPMAGSPEVRRRLSPYPKLGDDEMARRRLDAGIPLVPPDAGPADLPNEAGLEDAISYQKGCYLGQEVMARLKSMGQIRRRLMRVRGPEDPPAILPASLFAEEREVGEIRSAVRSEGGFIGLAMISLLKRPQDGTGLALTPGGTANVEVVEAP